MTAREEISESSHNVAYDVGCRGKNYAVDSTEE